MKLTNLNKKIMGILIAMGLTVPAFASIAVSPTRIEVNANKIKTNYYTTALEVKGDSNKPTRYKAYSGYFTINERGEMVMLDKTTDAHDLSKKIRFVPSEFTVSQGKSQKLRINISGLKQLPDGENRAVLYIEDINPREMNIPTGQSGIGAQLIVKTRVGVPIYIDNGKFSKVAEIESFELIKAKDGVYTNLKILSKGNSKIRYTGKIQIIQGKKLLDEYNLTGRAVGANNYYIDKQKMKLDKIKGVGEYTVRAVISYRDENDKLKNIKKDTQLNIQGEM